LPPTLEAPNVVSISPELVTAGQPTPRALAQLAAGGFEAVIYLAPPSVSDAVAAEAELLRQQGVQYVNIPIPFDAPTADHFRAVSAALTHFRGRKVLVHCQVNLRASTMVFLHRVIVGRESPEKAYENVAQVWSPRGPWKELVASLLRENGIPFEPY